MVLLLFYFIYLFIYLYLTLYRMNEWSRENILYKAGNSKAMEIRVLTFFWHLVQIQL